jgi:DUF4097 and DUF4098 domain-containing protein YvlB
LPCTGESYADTEDQSSPSAKLMTKNGSVSLTLPATASASLNAETTVGQIESDLPGAQKNRLNMGGEELKAKLGTGENPIQLRTVNGSIRIQTKG